MNDDDDDDKNDDDGDWVGAGCGGGVGDISYVKSNKSIPMSNNDM